MRAVIVFSLLVFSMVTSAMDLSSSKTKNSPKKLTSVSYKINDFLNYHREQELEFYFATLDPTLKKEALNHYLDGLTVLHRAMMKKKISIDSIRILLQHGADPNQPTLRDDHRSVKQFYRGWTIAFFAARYQKYTDELFNLLLEYDCDFLKKDDSHGEQWSAYDLAKRTKKRRWFNALDLRFGEVKRIHFERNRKETEPMTPQIDTVTTETLYSNEDEVSEPEVKTSARTLANIDDDEYVDADDSARQVQSERSDRIRRYLQERQRTEERSAMCANMFCACVTIASFAGMYLYYNYGGY